MSYSQYIVGKVCNAGGIHGKRQPKDISLNQCQLFVIQGHGKTGLQLANHITIHLHRRLYMILHHRPYNTASSREQILCQLTCSGSNLQNKFIWVECASRKLPREDRVDMLSDRCNLAKNILIPQKMLSQRLLCANRSSQTASKNPHQSHGE